MARLRFKSRAGSRLVAMTIITDPPFYAVAIPAVIFLGLSVNIAAKIAESSVSSAAALHLACAVPKADWGVSLTHFYLAEDIVRRPLALAGGLVALPDGPGLGVEVDEASVERFRVR